MLLTDKGSMVQAQFCSLNGLSYSMARLFDSFEPDDRTRVVRVYCSLKVFIVDWLN